MSFPRPFGPYTLLARVSAGGMAEVFRARRNEHGYLVALKKILPNIAEDDEFISMFEDEAHIVSRLEHPHIARMLDFGRVKESYYIAFEYVHGKDLRAVFERSTQSRAPIPLPFVLYAFSRIGEGLSYAHARRDEKGLPVSIVHRDISPQNIIVSSEGDIKLIDFGIAKAQGKASQTAAGSIKGSFGYMSPEQVCGAEVSAQTDVFAMGICLWELLTQRRLFDGDNEFVVLQKIRGAAQGVAPPSRFRADVPPELDRVVLRALATDLSVRYRSAKELYRELHAVAVSTGALASRMEMATYMRTLFPELTARNESENENENESENENENERVRERIGWQDAPPRDTPAHDGPFDGSQVSGTMSAKERREMSDDEGGNGLPGEEEADTINGPLPLKPPPPAKPPPPTKPRTALRDALRVSSPPPVHEKSLTRPPDPPPAPPRPNPNATMQSLGGGGRPYRQQTLPGVHVPMAGEITSSDLTPVAVPFSATTPVTYPAAAAYAQAFATPHRLATTSPSPSSASSSNSYNGAQAVPVDWDDEHEASNVLDHEYEPRLSVPSPPEPPSAHRPSNPGGSQAQPARRYGPAPQAPQASPPPSYAAPQTPAYEFRPQPQPPSSRRPALAVPMSIPMNSAPTPSAPPTPPTYGGGGSHSPSHAPPFPHAAPAPRAAPAPHAAPAPRANRNEATALVRPPPGRLGLVLALGASLLVVMAMALLIVFFPRTGRVAIRVADAKGANYNRVEIFIDGRKHCDTSPCLVEGVSAGPHSAKVIASDGTVSERAFVSEARKQTPVDFVLTSARRITGLKLAASQPGMKLYVDGREMGLLPQEVQDLASGDHKIRIVGSERYEPLERTVTVAKDEMLDLGTLSLKVLRGKVTITLGTPGAKVYLVSGTDRRDLPTFPISVDIDASNTTKTWVLEASRLGFSEYKQPISFADGQAEKSFHVQLEPKPAAPPAPPVIVAAPRPMPSPAPNKAEAPAPGAASDNAPPGEAFLNINSIPASSVVLDGKPIGSTPKVRYSVPPGNHTVVFVNAEQGLRKSVQVSVASGDTKPVIGKLRE